MKSVFFIDKEKFLRTMLELVFKERGLDIYTIESGADCTYLIDDLTPDLIVADLATLSPDIETFFSSFEERNITVPILALGMESDWDQLEKFQDRFVGLEKKPLSPTGIVEKLEAYCV
ncbi:MAG: hypothetical protein KAG61_01830 [Bacteriovoracaceae bacterium]|nr:hypothetical protein [Bacteriovoracaceae bacterium]